MIARERNAANTSPKPGQFGKFLLLFIIQNDFGMQLIAIRGSFQVDGERVKRKKRVRDLLILRLLSLNYCQFPQLSLSSMTPGLVTPAESSLRLFFTLHHSNFYSVPK
jgi:hypothetical protein